MGATLTAGASRRQGAKFAARPVLARPGQAREDSTSVCAFVFRASCLHADKLCSMAFRAPIEETNEETADELPPLSVAPMSRRRGLATRMWWVAAVVGAVVLLVLALLR